MNPAQMNPFPNDPDRRELWDMVVRRDIEAFLKQDWDALKDNFIAEGFFGIDGRVLTNIDSWRMTFPNLEAYRREWLKQAAEYTRRSSRSEIRKALYGATKLRDIEIYGNTALLHRKFDGWLTRTKGKRVSLQWQTLYVCRKVAGRWKVVCFTGYLPNVSLESVASDGARRKPASTGAWQHVNSLSDVSALKTLLAEIERSRKTGMGADERQWLDRACALLGEAPSGHADYAALAAKSGVSYEVFRHRFRRLTGLSPSRYRKSRIIEQACQLLCTTRRTVAEIAEDLGFCDEFHFSRSFKKITGQNPTTFRRNVLAHS